MFKKLSCSTPLKNEQMRHLRNGVNLTKIFLFSLLTFALSLQSISLDHESEPVEKEEERMLSSGILGWAATERTTIIQLNCAFYPAIAHIWAASSARKDKTKMVVCIPNTSIQRSTFLLFYYSSTTDQAGRCFLPPTSPTLAYNHGHGRPMPGATPRFTQSQRRSPSLFSLFFRISGANFQW